MGRLVYSCVCTMFSANLVSFHWGHDNKPGSVGLVWLVWQYLSDNAQYSLSLEGHAHLCPLN